MLQGDGFRFGHEKNYTNKYSILGLNLTALRAARILWPDCIHQWLARIHHFQLALLRNFEMWLHEVTFHPCLLLMRGLWMGILASASLST